MEKSMAVYEELFKKIKLEKAVKGIGNGNPVMTQRFGADPYALVYGDRVYVYMTGDAPTYDETGKVEQNKYSLINTINVVSSADLVNWTDHGTVYAASERGAAKWGANSWAPAAAYKKINGKDKFFLYFANSGNGIAVLSADSPVGPFTDPIGKPLISRNTPTCAEVTWLFDPAVLQDTDGNAYIYVGGGIPSDEFASNPGTARVCKLGADMISLDGDPIPIDNVPFLFEDSGINKINGVYYYSYCSNFKMTPPDVERMGFGNGQIIVMKSDNPMGHFKLVGPVLKNPEDYFGRGGNNHHCMFEFKGEYYIVYHSRILEEAMGIDGGYRSTNIDRLMFDVNGVPTMSEGTKAGVDAVGRVNPYTDVSGVTLGNSAGITTRQYGEIAEKYGSGQMILSGIHDGCFTEVRNVAFGDKSPKSVSLLVAGSGKGTVKVSLDAPENPAIAYVPVDTDGSGLVKASGELILPVTGDHDLFFVFEGSGYELFSWKFE